MEYVELVYVNSAYVFFSAKLQVYLYAWLHTFMFLSFAWCYFSPVYTISITYLLVSLQELGEKKQNYI